MFLIPYFKSPYMIDKYSFQNLWPERCIFSPYQEHWSWSSHIITNYVNIHWQTLGVDSVCYYLLCSFRIRRLTINLFDIILAFGENCFRLFILSKASFLLYFEYICGCQQYCCYDKPQVACCVLIFANCRNVNIISFCIWPSTTHLWRINSIQLEFCVLLFLPCAWRWTWRI